LHRVLGGHTKAALLNTILARLRDAGTVRVEKTETGGRPGERWYACEQSEQTEQSRVAGPDQGLCSLNSLCSHGDQDNDTDTGTNTPEPADDDYEPSYCRGCQRMLTDRSATVVTEFASGGDLENYCRSCFEAGRVMDGLTSKPWKWSGSQHPIGHSFADGTAPVAVCDHLDQGTWVVTDGKAHCPVCTKYMGRVR
jgi:hypothetical protein